MGRFGQRPELSGDWCSSGTLHPGQVLRGRLLLLSPAFLDVFIVATRCLHVRHGVRDPSGGRWNLFCRNGDFHAIQESFTCRKSTTWDRRLYFPSEGWRAEDFFRPEKSDGFGRVEPANLGTKGQHATPRPPKPLREGLRL